VRNVIAVALFFMMWGWFSTSPALAIDCPRAETRVEHLICSSDYLIGLDSQMSSLYFYLRNNASRRGAQHLLNNQRAWLTKRNRCRNFACLEGKYIQRIHAFEEVIYN